MHHLPMTLTSQTRDTRNLGKRTDVGCIKGVMSWEFCRFLVQTILKLVLGNLTHAQHSVFEHLKRDITLNLQRENQTTAINIDFLKTC